MGKTMQLPVSKPSDFYVPASSENSPSTVLKLRLDRKYVAAIRLLVQGSRDIHGWVFDTDFLRWAVKRGLEEMSHRVKSSALSATVAALRLADSAAQARMRHEQFQQAVDGATKEIEYLDRQGDFAAARNLVHELYKQVQDDPEPFWRRKWSKQLVSRFGRALTDVQIKRAQEEADAENSDE